MKDYYLMRKGKNILTVLYYHRVTDICKDGMTVGIEAFEKQIRFLKTHYNILSIEDLNKILDRDSNKAGSKGEREYWLHLMMDTKIIILMHYQY